MADLTVPLDGETDDPYDAPAGFTYTTGSGEGRIFGNNFRSKSASTAAIVCQSMPVGSPRRVSVVLGNVSGSDSAIACWVAENGNGYFVLIRSGDLRIFRATATNTSLTQVGTTYSGAFATDDVVEISCNPATGEINCYQNTVLRRTVTDTTHIAEQLKMGFGGRGANGGLKSATIYNLISVDSINGGNPIINGQAAVPFTTAGFNADTITAITTNQTGVTCSGIVNSGGGAGTFNLSDMADGVAYPVLPASVVYTFSDGTNTATITEDLELEPGWEQVSYVAAFPLNDRVFCWHLDQAGISIEDGTVVIWESILDENDDPLFQFTADGDSISDIERTVLAKVRDESTGLMSFWTVTINEAGEVINADRGITAVGLTMSGIAMRGITAVGL